MDYMLLCDHVRPEGGMVHLLGGGIERVGLPQVPAVVPLGVAARVTFDDAEVKAAVHSADLSIIGPDDGTVLEVRGVVAIQPPANMPDGWATSSGVVANVLVPVQAFGVHAVHLTVDEQPLKIVRFVVHRIGEG
ncbi:MAG TPA: hypothetical protein VF657_14210 [Actinoplanes sp.]